MRSLRYVFLLAVCLLLIPAVSSAGEVWVFGMGDAYLEVFTQDGGSTQISAWEAGELGQGGDLWSGEDYVGHYADGVDEYRGYYLFNIPFYGYCVECGPEVYDAGDPITSATLYIYNPSEAVDGWDGYMSENPYETVTVHGLSGGAIDWLMGQLYQADTGASVFQELGTGPLYSSHSVSPADNGEYVPFALGAGAVGAINTAMFDYYASPYVGFGTALADSSVPEPASWALALVPLALGFGAWRKRRP